MHGLLSRAQLASGIIASYIFINNEVTGVAEMPNKQLYGFIFNIQICKGPTDVENTDK